MRNSAQTTGRTLTNAKRWILLPVGALVLCAWILGDLGVIGFPTLYNGKLVYPVAGGVMQLKYIYTSPIALALYAWFSPIAEATVVWMLSHLIINARAFLAGSVMSVEGSRPMAAPVSLLRLRSFIWREAVSLVVLAFF
jgi:hypothetical protein